MNRLPNPSPDPRRPALEFGEGASLVEPANGAAADLVRSGGKVCPLCCGEASWGDMQHEGRTITVEVVCDCGFRAVAEFRLIDAEV